MFGTGAMSVQRRVGRHRRLLIGLPHQQQQLFPVQFEPLGFTNKYSAFQFGHFKIENLVPLTSPAQAPPGTSAFS